MSRVGLLVAALAAPSAASACAVCFDASEDTRQAFFNATIFLSLLPLAMLGGIGLLVRRAYGPTSLR